MQLLFIIVNLQMLDVVPEERKAFFTCSGAYFPLISFTITMLLAWKLGYGTESLCSLAQFKLYT